MSAADEATDGQSAVDDPSQAAVAADGEGAAAEQGLGSDLAFMGWTIMSRTLGWGALGLFLGCFVFFGLNRLLLLEHPRVGAWKWSLLPLYMLSGAGLLAWAGLGRGLGRVAIYAMIKRGLARSLTERALELTAKRVQGDSPLSETLEAGEIWLQDLPLQRMEDYLKKALCLAGDEDAGEAPGMARSFLLRQLERRLLRVVRAEVKGQGGGGICLKRVQELALESLDGLLDEFILGFMKKQTLVASLILLAIFLAGPLVIGSLR